jgi:hypothetical protein
MITIKNTHDPELVSRIIKDLEKLNDPTFKKQFLAQTTPKKENILTLAVAARTPDPTIIKMVIAALNGIDDKKLLEQLLTEKG